MCDTDQIALLTSIDKHLHQLCHPRGDIDQVYMIMTTQPLVVDYKERLSVFLFSPNALTFSVGDLGTLGVAASTWTNISFQEGTRLTPLSQVSPIEVFVRATDGTLPNTMLNLAQVGGSNIALGSAPMLSSIPVTMANDQFLAIGGESKEISGLSVSAAGQDLLPSTDISPYLWVSVQVTGVWTGSLRGQGSNDGITFLDFPGYSAPGTFQSAQGGHITANNIVIYPRYTRFFRVHCQTLTSGTANGVVELHTSAVPYPLQSVAISNIPTVITEPSSNNISVATGAANTIIKAAAGTLATIVVTATGTGAGNVQIFDNASTNAGTVLFAFPANAAAAQSYQIYGWAKLGMVAQNVLNGPVFTVFFS